ncbi:MAG TPA: MFS transporter [Actinocrinis sp.]|jgi:EmrB/QacA subfamily drug resistance transporter
MRKWWPLVAVSLGTFMLLVDVTIVNVALPQMAVGLDTSFSSLQWVVDGYALSLGVVLLGAGALGDLLGHRSLYVVGLVVFALSSAACGLSPNGGVLIAARVVQGVGGAAMFTTTYALLGSSYQGRERGTAFGIWGGVSGAAAAIGPVLGGLLTQGIGWRWIFYVNVPISVVAIVLCYTVLGADRRRAGERFDLVGTLAFTVFAAPLTLAVIRANSVGWGSVQTWGLIVLSGLGLTAFVLAEKYGSNAMLDLGLLRNKSFVGILVAALMVNFAAFSVLTYVSVWLQSVTGLSPIESGLTGLPMSVCVLVASALGGRFLHDRSPRLAIGGGMLLVAAGAAICGLMIGADSDWTALMAGYAVIGLGVGFVMPILSSTAMSSVPPKRGGMAAGAVTTARQLGFAIGIAVLGTLFSARAQTYLTAHGAPDPANAARGLAGGQADRIIASVPSDLRETVSRALHGAAASGLDAGFLVAAAVGLVAGVAVLVLVRQAPAHQGGSHGQGGSGGETQEPVDATVAGL